jgi:hypothetical protein
MIRYLSNLKIALENIHGICIKDIIYFIFNPPKILYGVDETIHYYSGKISLFVLSSEIVIDGMTSGRCFLFGDSKATIINQTGGYIKCFDNSSVTTI